MLLVVSAATPVPRLGSGLSLGARSAVGYQVRRVALAEDGKSLFEAVLLYEAVPGEVSAGGVARDEVLLGEEGLRARVVSGREVDLGEPEGILVVV